MDQLHTLNVLLVICKLNCMKAMQMQHKLTAQSVPKHSSHLYMAIVLGSRFHLHRRWLPLERMKWAKSGQTQSIINTSAVWIYQRNIYNRLLLQSSRFLNRSPHSWDLSRRIKPQRALRSTHYCCNKKTRKTNLFWHKDIIDAKKRYLWCAVVITS